MKNAFANCEYIERIISSKSPINYSFIIKNRNLVAILEESKNRKATYYFNPIDNQSEVTSDVIERALRTLISSNCEEFDILCACFYGLRKQEQYCSIAIRVFKEYWNKLYNLAIADEVFERQITFDDQTYDFFDKVEQ